MTATYDVQIMQNPDNPQHEHLEHSGAMEPVILTLELNINSLY